MRGILSTWRPKGQVHGHGVSKAWHLGLWLAGAPGLLQTSLST